MKKTLMCLGFALVANSAFAADKTPSTTLMDEVQAHKIIQEYRELRESCATGNYEQRRQCVNELSKASSLYREAKDVIEVASLSGAQTLASSYQ